VPIGQLRDDVPPGVTATIDRCLQKDPAARFQSIAELATALEGFGSPGAKEMAERVRLVAPSVAAAGRASSDALISLASAPEASSAAGLPVASSRVAVTGGTSVSWGETQLASKLDPAPKKRASWLLGAASVLVLLGGGLLAWRSYTPGAVGSGPMASAQGATIAAIASGMGPRGGAANEAMTGEATTAEATTAPPVTHATSKATATTTPTVATAIATLTVPTAATTKLGSVHTTVTPTMAKPHASAAGSVASVASAHTSMTPAGSHKPDELPNERE
jgi:serine/threonine-protein kinase